MAGPPLVDDMRSRMDRVHVPLFVPLASVNLVPDLPKTGRRRPRQLLVAQPHADEMALVVVGSIREGFARVEYGQVVDDLHVARPELDRQRTRGSREVDCIEGLGLGFGELWKGGWAREDRAARELAARETKEDFAVVAVIVEVEEHGSGVG